MAKQTSAEGFKMQPDLQDRFNKKVVHSIIHTALGEFLSSVQYSEESVANLSKEMAEVIKARVKDLNYKRWKIVVQVLIGEQKGQGVYTGSRCIWDADCDDFATDMFVNDSLFCVASVFGIYFY